MPALECSFHKWRGFFPPWAPWRGGWWKFEVISWESLKFLSNPNYLVIIGGEGKISIYLEVFEGWFLNRILEQWGWRWNGKNIPFLEQCGNLSCKVLPCRDCVLCVLDDVCREKLENYSDFHFNPQSSLITPAHPREGREWISWGQNEETAEMSQLQVTIPNPHLQRSQTTAEADLKVNIYKSFFADPQIQLSWKGSTNYQQIGAATLNPLDESLLFCRSKLAWGFQGALFCSVIPGLVSLPLQLKMRLLWELLVLHSVLLCLAGELCSSHFGVQHLCFSH